jgi:hypothetical protein
MLEVVTPTANVSCERLLDGAKHRCRIGTVPSAVAPGQSLSPRVLILFDPALPRSVLCLSGIALRNSSS